MLGHTSALVMVFEAVVCEPPTIVSCAPRRMALGSKLDIQEGTLQITHSAHCSVLVAVK